MSNEEEAVFTIRGIIASLPADEREACNELADHLRRQLACAGEPVGTLALSLVGAETQLAAAKGGAK